MIPWTSSVRVTSGRARVVCIIAAPRQLSYACDDAARRETPYIHWRRIFKCQPHLAPAHEHPTLRKPLSLRAKRPVYCNELTLRDKCLSDVPARRRGALLTRG